MVYAFIACQAGVVFFIAFHDWIPLGGLNNLGGIRSVDSTRKLLVTTFLSTLPFAAGLIGSIDYASVAFPPWLWWTLWISYGAGCYGMLRAWWLPYLLIEDPARAARYQARFAHTHAFLPKRNGIRPDTLHVTFHAVLITTTILLVLLSVSKGHDRSVVPEVLSQGGKSGQGDGIDDHLRFRSNVQALAMNPATFDQ